MVFRKSLFDTRKHFKGFLAVVLLFGLISLSEFSLKIDFQKRPPVQNEQVIGSRRVQKSALSFKKVFVQMHKRVICAEIYKNRYANIISRHNTLAKIVLAHVAEKTGPGIEPGIRIPLKTTPAEKASHPLA